MSFLKDRRQANKVAWPMLILSITWGQTKLTRQSRAGSCLIISKTSSRCLLDRDFESLKSKIHRSFEQNHDRLNTFFDRLEEAFNVESSNEVQVEQNISSNRQISSLGNPPTASSKWCSDLSTYIMSNLSQTVEDLKKDCRNIKQKAVRNISEFTTNRRGAPLERIKRLLDGWNAQINLQEQFKNAKSNLSSWHIGISLA